ncbi:amino acid transporter TAT1 SKDI_02G1750 [Saccharomyces kudriavzevii IFO 1802]|uniref:TAT1-like protein n=2 Tax=Saccharomyces kudriavzevii (strain ATCC MYA-4449 / AS 2.2408 / CBS 8840 / NBRC 1802 / NCYC 2889) TaxID=226230 RepID=J8TY62_SACK1|nr:uncharacterized protein SKDI_02G1750 [Saccharomyces kudriavzevii IFO 1802]EJT44691.1 TAT1-like protein [Saccharomyces kudriavzevii IFO 1802]CAI4055400.1 hypothetical protein SKDI_02G1750 [Saccharomyces kudriavzevii IFO 1802]
MNDSDSFTPNEASLAPYPHSLHDRGNAEKKKRDFTITEKQNEEPEQQGSPQKTDRKPKLRNEFRKFFDSFKRQLPSDQNSELESQEKNNLRKSIKSRHLVMISLGTGIGTGLLVGNGQVLGTAGPAGLVLGYGIASIMLYCIIQAAGELGLCYAGLTGNYTRYSSILVDPSLGFAVSVVYTIQWLTVLPLQLVTAAMTVKYWTNVNADIFVAVVFIFVIIINLFGSRGYAEAEFIFNICKILMVAGFVILAIVINCGGAGDRRYIGTEYWHNPGPFAHGFKGVCTVFCYAAFSYGGIEVLLLSAAEQENPTESIPNACKKVVYRILLIYMLTTILIGFLVPYNSDELLGSGSSSGSHASPFVIAVSSHGVKVVPHFINAVILISVISVANSSLYSGPRLLLSLAEQGVLPKCLAYVDRNGRPLLCFLVSLAFGCIGFVATSNAEEQVFTWLLAISSLSQLFIWMSMCLSHIRFRDAMAKQGRSMDEVGYKAQTGYWGSWIAVLIAVFFLVCQFWVAIAPVSEHGKLDVKVFFQNYLAMPIVLLAYFGHKMYFKSWRFWIPAEKIDLDSHRNVYLPPTSTGADKIDDDDDVTEYETSESSENLHSSRLNKSFKKMVNFWC